MPALLGDEDAGSVERRPPPQRTSPLSADRIPIPPVPTSGRACRDEIEHHRRLLSDDKHAADSTLWDTWLRNEHDVRHASYIAGMVSRPRRAR
ncbi:hypothetical protein D1007_45897 [Hordeum vulgare]|nr:hypothetical protein D1007_45897 [Hordeum vulgare]